MFGLAMPVMPGCSHSSAKRAGLQASSFFARFFKEMRISVVNAYINPCSDSIEIIFEIQEVSLC